MLNKVINKFQSILSLAVNNAYEKIQRRRLRNHDFTILCSNCAGGVIYHRCGLQFRSPTVNLWLHQRDFLKLAANKQEAADDWNRRKSRINYENLFLLMYDRENLSIDELRRIEQIPCRGKVVFSDHRHPELDYVVTMKPSNRLNGAQCMDQNWLGIRSFERQFDYVRWLNSGK